MVLSRNGDTKQTTFNYRSILKSLSINFDILYMPILLYLILAYSERFPNICIFEETNITVMTIWRKIQYENDNLCANKDYKGFLFHLLSNNMLIFDVDWNKLLSD